MPLRSPNDHDPANLVMQAMLLVLPGYPTTNTLLGELTNNTAINSWGALYGTSGQGAVFPFLMLEESTQSVERKGVRTWQGSVLIKCNYLHRWDRQPLQTDRIWANIDTDLRRMKANLEDNPTLTVQVSSLGEASPVRHAVAVRAMHITPYSGSMTLDIYPFGLVGRTLNVEIELPPYVGAA